MDFTDTDGVNKALELNKSKCGESTLTVEEAKPRGDSVGSDRGDGGWSFGYRGRGFDGRSGGRGRLGTSDGGGRFSRWRW